MGTLKNRPVPGNDTSSVLSEAPRFTLLEALEDAIDSLEQLDSGEWEPDTSTFESVLQWYRETVEWEKQRTTLFILTDEDAQHVAKVGGLATPLTTDELRQIQRGVEAGLGEAQYECLDAAIDCVMYDRAAQKQR